tara:strand:+ start:2688 stop:3347 length:660 start_codon:yes stop_codon:yes gene_type:complete
MVGGTMIFKTIISAVITFTIGALILVGVAAVNNNQLIAQNGKKIINLKAFVMDDRQQINNQKVRSMERALSEFIATNDEFLEMFYALQTEFREHKHETEEQIQAAWDEIMREKESMATMSVPTEEDYAPEYVPEQEPSIDYSCVRAGNNLSNFIKKVKLRKTQEFTVSYSVDNYNLIDLQYSKTIPANLERKVTEYVLSFATTKQFSKDCSIPIKVVVN